MAEPKTQTEKTHEKINNANEKCNIEGSKCCGRIQGFFTREDQNGCRVLNWKCGVAIALVIVVLAWIII